MTHKYDVTRELLSLIGYKGTFYPGIGFNKQAPIERGGKYSFPNADPLVKYTTSGRVIRNIEANGEVIYMPVKIDGIELPNAVISITGKKTIVETALVGGRGTVKELISMDDYEISLAGVIVDRFDEYPEKLVKQFHKIWLKNEAVTLLSAISDAVLIDTRNIIIKTIDFPPVGAFENAQIISLTAVSDYPCTLTID